MVPPEKDFNNGKSNKPKKGVWAQKKNEKQFKLKKKSQSP